MQPESNSISMLRSLKGPGLSMLMALMIFGGLINKQLVIYTGYSKDKVAEGLLLLESYGLVERPSRYGKWVLTAKSKQLILPLENSSPRISSSPALNASASSSFDDSLLIEEEEEERTKSSPRISSSILANLEALEVEGVYRTKKAAEVAGLEYVTPEYISGQAERLRFENKFSPGLLLRVIIDHDPLPEVRSCFGYTHKQIEKAKESGELLGGWLCPWCLGSPCHCDK